MPVWVLLVVLLATPSHGATVTWIEHADGAWNDPSHWSTGAVPGPSDDVVIDVPESVTITFSASDDTVASVDLHEVLRITNGRLTVNGGLANAGTVALEGGTLRGAAIAGGTVTYASGNLDSLTLGTGTVLEPAGAGAVITVLRGLSLDGALIRIGFPPDSSSAVNFSGGSQTLGGTGEVEFVSSNAGNLLRATSGGALTLGPNIVVHGRAGTVGNPALGFVNQGTIAADGASSHITITGASWQNAAGGTIRSTASGACIELAGTNWCNSGIIEATTGEAVLDIAGSTTSACLGNFQGAAGQVRLVSGGRLDCTSQSLYLSPGIGSLELAGGRLGGGRVTGSGTAQLLYSWGDLDRVTLGAGTVLEPAGAGAVVTVLNGLVLDNARIRIGYGPDGGSAVNFSAGPQTLGGAGEVEFVSSSVDNLLRPTSAGALTLGANITVHGRTGTVGNPALGLVNQGTIVADVTASDITVTGAGWQNASGGRIRSIASPSRIELAGTNWCNSGLIEATAGGAILDIAGSTTSACLGNFQGAAARVRLVSGGILDNTGRDLLLSPGIGALEMAGGELVKGTVTGSGAAQLLYSSGDLDSLKLGAGTILEPAGPGAVITVLRGLTLDNAVIRIGYAPDSSSAVNFSGGSQTLGGTGEVEFESSSVDNFLRPTSGGALTIGPNITVHGWAGTVGNPTLSLFNQGTIAADGASSDITITGTNWQNAAGGRIRSIVSGARIDLAGTNWCNSGLIEATAGGAILDIAGSTTSACLGTFYGAAGRVRLIPGGELDNAGNNLLLSPDIGDLEMAGGTLVQGTVTGSGSAKLIYTPSSGTLDSLTLSPGTVLEPAGPGAKITVVGGLTLDNALIRIGIPPNGNSSVNFSGGSQTLEGTGEVEFESSGDNLLRPTAGGTLSIGPNITVHGWEGTVGNPALGLVNQGTIAADTTVSDITITGTDWCNAGVIEATVAGAILEIKGSTTTSCLGDFRGVPGHVHLGLGGLIDNAGDSLFLAPKLGAFEIAGGTIRGGLVSGEGTAQFEYSSGSLDNVIVAPGTIVRPSSTNGATLTVLGHMRLDGALWLGLPAGGWGAVTFSGSQTLDGQGEVVFVSNSPSNTLASSAGTLTLGGSVLVHGRAGTIGAARTKVVNRTTVTADSSGLGFTLVGSSWRNEGTLRCDRGAGDLAGAAPFVNTGLVTIDSARTFSITSPGTYTQTGGTLTLRNGTIGSPSSLQVQGGSVQGVGTIAGGLSHGGQVHPGFSPGTLAVVGRYSLADSAGLWMEIAGPDSSQHDRLVVSGNAELKGTLHVSLVAPYVPALGDSFVIMTYDGLLGGFPQLDLPPLPDGMGWQVRYRPTLLSLRASTTTDVEGEPSPGTGGNLPLAFRAYPNEPNPFNPVTRIRFDLPREALTDLVIYDARGRVVRRLLEGVVYPAGRSAVNWDGRNDAGRQVASGVYLYRFRAGDSENTHRMVLVK